MTTNSERVILQVGDVLARKYEWSDDWLHFIVDESNLADCQRVVDAGLWRVVRTKEGELK